MAWKITNDRIQRSQSNGPTFNPKDPQSAHQEAKDRLREMALSLVDHKGQVKSGYLKLTQDRDGLKLGRRWFGANAATQDARALVSSLLNTAYADKPTTLKAAQDALDQYLRRSNNRLGTQSFVNLVRQLQAAEGELDHHDLAQVTVNEDARLKLSSVPERIKMDEITHRLHSLKQQIDTLPEPSLAHQVLLRRNAEALSWELPVAPQDNPLLSDELNRIRANIDQVSRPPLPIKVNLDPFGHDVAVHAFLDQALQGKPATLAQRLEALKDLPASRRNELLSAFNGPGYCATVMDLSTLNSPLATTALNELRDLEHALATLAVEDDLHGPEVLQAFTPPANPAINLPENQLAPLKEAVKNLAQAADDDNLDSIMVGLRAVGREVQNSVLRQEKTLAKGFDGEDQRKEFRYSLIEQSVASLDQRSAALVLQKLASQQVDELSGIFDFMLPNLVGKYGVPGDEIDAFQTREMTFAKATDELMQCLALKVRGHQQNTQLVARRFSNHFFSNRFNAAHRQALWKAHADDPSWSRMEINATLHAAEKIEKGNRPESLEKARQRATVVKATLDKTGLTQAAQRAQMAHCLAHPGSFDPKFGDAFVYLLGSSAKALLDAPGVSGRALTDAQVWKAVVGDDAPEDLTSTGDPQLAPRIIQAVTQKLQVQLQQKGRTIQDLAPLHSSGLPISFVKGLMQGISWRTQLAMIQDPTHALTAQDFFPADIAVISTTANESNAYAQTQDIHRWQRPTQFVFEGAQGAPGSVLDPNTHPGSVEREPNMNPASNDPVIVDLHARIATLANTDKQLKSVSVALSQASTMVFRIGAESLPLANQHPQTEHGAYTFTLARRENGDVSVAIRANEAMPFEGELRLVVNPQGLIATEDFTMRARVPSN